MFTPLFVGCASIATWLFEVTSQPPALIELEATYLRLLMIGAVGMVLETAPERFL